jgi:predicted  nucleic acid-binding Zn-ribbon protein
MEADRWIDRVTSQRGHLPEMAELSSIEVELRGLVTALQEAQQAVAPVQKRYEAAQGEADRLRRRAGELEKTLAASTANARELAALQKELEHVRELLGRADDVELELLMELEPLDEALADIKARAQPAIARRGELQGVIAELQASLDEELAALRTAREDRVRAVSPDVLARYDHAMARVGGSGAANVDGARCDGCRIALSPLDCDRWKGQPVDTFMACPECGRLLLP